MSRTEGLSTYSAFAGWPLTVSAKLADIAIRPNRTVKVARTCASI